MVHQANVFEDLYAFSCPRTLFLFLPLCENAMKHKSRIHSPLWFEEKSNG